MPPSGRRAIPPERPVGDRAILANVQFLRFVAAGSVLVAHAQHEAQSIAPMTAWEPVFWGIGVDIFFVISGFIMFHLAAGKFARPGYAAQFMKRRLIRVVPLYWLFTTAMIASIVLFADSVKHNQLDLGQIVRSFLFLPWARPDGAVRPVLILGWTLNYEMLFYTVFAVALLFRRRIALPALFALFVIASLVHFALPDQLTMLRFWSDPIILLFAIGIGIALLHERGVHISGGTALMLIALGIAVLIVNRRSGLDDTDLPRVIKTAIPAALIAAAAMLARHEPAPGRWRTFMLESGNVSYALYLSHPFALNALGIVWRRLHLVAPVGFFIASCVAALVGAFVVYHFIERPLLRWLSPRPGPPETYRVVPD